MNLPALSIIIPTLDRSKSLEETLNCIKRQTLFPESIIVVDASSNRETEETCKAYSKNLPIKHYYFGEKSSAKQRNFGATKTSSKILLFLDDDITFKKNLIEKCLKKINSNSKIKALSPRMEGIEHKQPSSILKLYYWIQAGYTHSNYGGKLFGYGINCLPCYSLEKNSLIESEWLHSSCLFIYKKVFDETRFPSFTDYSFMEDVYLTAKVAQRNKVYFYKDISFKDKKLPSDLKKDPIKLTQMKIKNQGIIAKEILKLSPFELFFKKLLHRIFLTICFIKERKKPLLPHLIGLWS